MQPEQYAEQLTLCLKIIKFHRKKARESCKYLRKCRTDIKSFSQYIKGIRETMQTTKKLNQYLRLKKRLPVIWWDMDRLRNDVQEAKQEIEKHEEHASRMGKKLYEFVLGWEARQSGSS
jgi:predicted  nucleic acid-binding Zn-ribbon protein